MQSSRYHTHHTSFCPLSPNNVCSVYEAGVAQCSSDYLAHSLWDKYIHYEEEQGGAMAVTALYSRVLQCPLRELPRYMQRCGPISSHLPGTRPSFCCTASATPLLVLPCTVSC